MINISISISEQDQAKIRTALSRVENTTRNKAKRLPWEMANEYANNLRKNIQTGAFASTYPPYNLRYEDYKYKMVGHLKPWVLFGDVLANISVWHWRKGRGRGFKAGIPAGRMDRGEKGWFGTGAPSSIAAYAAANEFGLGPTPARPVFIPTLLQYQRLYLPVKLRKVSTEIKGVWHD